VILSRAAVLSGAIAAAVLLGASAAPEQITFPERWTPEVGARWSEDQSRHMTGHTKIHAGPAKLRDKQDDDGVEWSAAVEVTDVDEGKLSGFELVFSRALRREGTEPVDVGLQGVGVSGVGTAKRRWRTTEGKRLRKKARDFLDEQFPRDSSVDPVGILVPDRPVAVGDRWDVDMDQVLEWLGRDKLTLDAEQTHGRCTLESIEERRGVRYGRIGFEIAVVAETITNGGFDEAKMVVGGAVELPLQAHPGIVIEFDWKTRFDGWVKRRGVKARIDLDHHTVGRQERR